MRALEAILVIVILVAAAFLGYFVYNTYFAPGSPVSSQNWAGYADESSVSSANGSIALPSPSQWQGNGVAGLWVGMGGLSGLTTGAQWPFWQAGVVVTCSSGACRAMLFTEGGTSGAPCHGVCAPDWTQSIAYFSSMTIDITVAGGSSGATATFTVDQGGVATPYDPPAWKVLAGQTSFPSAEWIFESPQGTGGTDVMPTLPPPGAVFGPIGDSAHLGVMAKVVMQQNPNGQSVGVSTLSGGSFSAYSYNT